MPHETIWEEEGINWKFHGIVNTEEVHEADAEVYDDARFDDLKYFIWDATDMEKLEFEDLDVVSIAAKDTVAASYKKRFKGALIVKDAQISKTLDQYIHEKQALGSSWEIKKFRTIKDAREWIGCAEAGQRK